MSRTRAEMIEETRVKLLAAARKAFRDWAMLRRPWTS